MWKSSFMVASFCIVAGIGVSIIYFFENRCFENALKPCADKNKINEPKIIQKSD